MNNANMVVYTGLRMTAELLRKADKAIKKGNPLKLNYKGNKISFTNWDLSVSDSPVIGIKKVTIKGNF